MEYDFNRIKDVKGWLQPDGANMLYQCAMESPVNRILELGSFCGKSAIVLADAMKQKNGVVFCCDLFPKNVKNKWFEVEDTYEEFWKNIKERNLERYVKAVRGDYHNFLKMTEGCWGMCYIDGGHTVAPTLSCAMYAKQNVVKNGWIVFDDYENENWPDVKAVVDSLCRIWGKEIDRRTKIGVAIKQ